MSYVEARRREFMFLDKGKRSVAKFLRLSRYGPTLVASNNDNNVRFEEGLYYDLSVLIAS